MVNMQPIEHNDALHEATCHAGTLENLTNDTGHSTKAHRQAALTLTCIDFLAQCIAYLTSQCYPKRFEINNSVLSTDF
jgi:hypothetical protein